MPSLLTPLRAMRRQKSTPSGPSSRTSLATTESPPSPPSPPEPQASFSEQPEPGPSTLLGDRRILPDIKALLESVEFNQPPAGPSSGEHSLTTPLTPSRGHMRHFHPHPNPEYLAGDNALDVAPSGKGKARMSAVIADEAIISDDEQTDPDVSASISQLPSAWSTFGKKIKRSVPDLRDIGRRSGSGRSDGVTSDAELESTSYGRRSRSRRGSRDSPPRRSGSVTSGHSARSGHTFARGVQSKRDTGMWTMIHWQVNDETPSRRSSGRRSTISGAVEGRPSMSTTHQSSTSNRLERVPNIGAPMQATPSRKSSTRRSTISGAIATGRPSTSMTHRSTASNRIGRMPNVDASPDPSTSSTRSGSVLFTTPGANRRELSEYNSPRTFGHPTPGQHTRAGSTPTPPLYTPPILGQLEFPGRSNDIGRKSGRGSSGEDNGSSLSLPKTPATSSMPALTTLDQSAQANDRRPTRSASSTLLSFTFGRAFRSISQSQSQSTRTSKGTLFPSGSTVHELGHRGLNGRRARTESRSRKNKSSAGARRESAEWNAKQASEGVTARPSMAEDYGWPAEVSREMLRLTLMNPTRSYSTVTNETSLVPHGLLQNRNKPLPQIHNSHATTTTRQPPRGQSQLGTSDLPSSSPHPQPFSSSSPSSLSTPFTGVYGLQEPDGDPSVVKLKPFPTTTSRRDLSKEGLDGEQFAQTGSDRRDSDRDTRRHSSLPSNDWRRDNDRERAELADESRVSDDREDEAAGRMIQHIRTDSENQIRWESRQMQDFLATGIRLVERRPGTPEMKPSAGSSSLLSPPNVSVMVTAPTPQASPARPGMSSRSDDEDGAGEASTSLSVPFTDATPQRSSASGISAKSQGKRKAEESDVDGSPPNPERTRKPSGSRKTKTSFAATEGLERGPHRVSNNSTHAPSSFSNKSRKRVRLSSTPMTSPDHSRPGSATHSPTSYVNTSWSSKASSKATSAVQNPHSSQTNLPRAPSRATTHRTTMSAGMPPRHQKTRSMSGASIPLSAIVSPRAPSIDRLNQYHMRDPHKPRRRPVGWRLRRRTPEGDAGSPVHAWCFWLGLLFPPLWWIASFMPIPHTRVVGAGVGAAEKGIPVDDPHDEREARIWRRRCRIFSVVFFVTYAPVIILLAVFATR